jgi:tetratricopeptide (TPR) repeat protein
MNYRYIPSLILLGFFFSFFLLVSPLGIFNDSISPKLQTGFYSITRIDAGDDAGYYAYLRSIFFDGDIDFFNETNFAHAQKFMPTGYVFNNWQIGQSVLFFPFFLLGHFWASLLNFLGHSVTLDGKSFPYLMSTAWASQTYLFIGLVLTYKINRKFFDTTASLIATILVWLATSLLYYTFIRQRMSHTIEFFLAATFILVWLNNRHSSNALKHSALGIILGILCMARVINVALGVLYVIDQICIAGWLGKTDSVSKKTLVTRLAYFSISWLFAFSPQLLTWYKIDGIPLPALHAKIAQSETSAFSIGKIWEQTKSFFWGERWGLIFSSPIILVGTIGIIIGKPFSKIRLPFIVTVFAYFTIVILLFGYLDAYEYRYLSPALPIISLGLAAILTNLSKNRYGYWMIAFFSSIFISVQYFILIQYKISINHNDPRFIIEALNAIPNIITTQPSSLLRSSNFFSLFNSSTQINWTYLEYSYLLLYPLIQLGFIVTAAYLFFRKRTSQTSNNLKSIYGTGVALIFALNITLLIVAPPKTDVEIKSRLQYMQIKNLAKKAKTRGKFDEIEEHWEKASQLIPDFWIPYFRLGVLLTQQKSLVKANENLKKAHRLNPKHTGINFFLGLNLQTLGKYEESELYLRQAIRASPENPITYERLGLTLHQKGNLIEAEKYYKTCLLLSPDFSMAHLNLTILLRKLKRYDEAFFHLKKTIALGLRTPAVSALARAYKIAL